MTQFDDADVPVPGSGYSYLLQAGTTLGVKGSLGADGSGAERLNNNPSACP